MILIKYRGLGLLAEHAKDLRLCFQVRQSTACSVDLGRALGFYVLTALFQGEANSLLPRPPFEVHLSSVLWVDKQVLITDPLSWPSVRREGPFHMSLTCNVEICLEAARSARGSTDIHLLQSYKKIKKVNT